MITKFIVRALMASVVTGLLCGCNGGGTPDSSAPLPLGIMRGGQQLPLTRGRHRTSTNPITHIVIVVQENRSLNNLFYGYPGATTYTYGYTSDNKKVALKPVSLSTGWDIEHDVNSFFAACNGTGSIPGTDCQMNGFNHEDPTCGSKCPIKYPEYAYVPHSESKPYFDMAKQYVLADQMYASNFDGSSFVSHQYLIAGQAEKSGNYPISSWGCPGGSQDTIKEIGPQRQFPYGYEVVCWDPTTLGDELDSAGIPWAYYTVANQNDGGIWDAYQAIRHIYYGQDWTEDVFTPPTQFFSDVEYGKLRNVSWITPTCQNSDHAGCNSSGGPSWVTSIVNAIGTSQYWNSTAIFVLWDDYGGWYDGEPPNYVDFDGLGIRIPLLIISPYAKKGYVSHVQYEHGSILKFIENIFGLAAMAASDTRATSPAADCFDFSAPPRKFKKIKAPKDEAYFLDQPLDTRPPDTE